MLSAEEIDEALLSLVEKGLIEMSYDEKIEKIGEWVFWLKGANNESS